MIGLRHKITGECQFVGALDGIDLTVWQETGATMPADMATRRYTSVDGVLTPAPASLSLDAFLDLWTPAETVAVMQTTAPMLAYLWARTMASPSINLGDPRVAVGVQLAVEAAILTPARAAAILAGTPFL